MSIWFDADHGLIVVPAEIWGPAGSAVPAQVDGEVAWAKLRALRDGAELASSRLW